MRNTNVPPWWRANAQLNRAVRARPTCGLPVGEGQKRTRTFDAGASVTGNHLAGQGADAGDGDLDLVADVHGTDTLGGAGEDHVAGQQRHHRRDIGDERRNVEDHVLGGPVLDQVAVEVGGDVEVAV